MTDLSATLAWLIDIPSETGDEAAICDAVSPKLYTMHWSVMVEFWGRDLLAHNPGLDEALVVQALAHLFDLGDEITAEQLSDYGYRLGPVVVNRVHPELDAGGAGDGRELFRWLGERHRRGLEELRSLLPPDQALVPLPLTPDEPTDLASLAAVGRAFQAALSPI